MRDAEWTRRFFDPARSQTDGIAALFRGLSDIAGRKISRTMQRSELIRASLNVAAVCRLPFGGASRVLSICRDRRLTFAFYLSGFFVIGLAVLCHASPPWHRMALYAYFACF